MRRWCAAAGAAAVVGVGLVTVAATPAWAADPLELRIDNSVQGKVGDKVQVRFTVKNVSKAPVNGLVVGVTAPNNAVLDAGDNPGCTVGGGGHAASCRSNAALAADKSVSGSIVLVVKTAGQANGRMAVEHGNAANFALRAVGGPSPSVTKTTAKPSKTSSLSASETPGLADDASFAPPDAGNGVNIQPTVAQNANRTSSGGGMSLGLIVGIVAIVGALGLIGSLFYFRRKDRSEPDTGMHPVVPAPDGYPPSPGYGQPSTYGQPGGGYGQPNSYGQPSSYGQPNDYGQPGGYGQSGAQPGGSTYGEPTSYGQPSAYGSPAAATQMINPSFGGPPPASGPTQVIPPGPPDPDPKAPTGNDRTVVFRLPDGL
jgi:hypothetical protein